MKLSMRNTLIVVGGYQDRSVSIWNYEILNLLGVLEMEHPITAVCFA